MRNHTGLAVCLPQVTRLMEPKNGIYTHAFF